MQYSDLVIRAVALSFIPNLGAKTLLSIMQRFPSLDHLRNSPKDLRAAISRHKEQIAEEIEASFYKYHDEAERFLEECQSNDVKVSVYDDDLYPKLFTKIADPPPIIYLKGNVNLLNNQKSVAVIGTRSPTEHGKVIAERTTRKFSSSGYVIVSGLALGIDTIGHKTALSENNSTIAVLTDIDQIYPKENEPLAKEIVANNGLLIAENRPGSPASKGHFVSRDRLQSALSIAVFAIEAGDNSGTQHAVKAAKSQNRLVFCPDIEKHPFYEGSEPQIQGIKAWIKEGVAEPYTKEKYAKIIEKLHHTEESLNATFANEQHEQNCLDPLFPEMD